MFSPQDKGDNQETFPDDGYVYLGGSYVDDITGICICQNSSCRY